MLNPIIAIATIPIQKTAKIGIHMISVHPRVVSMSCIPESSSGDVFELEQPILFNQFIYVTTRRFLDHMLFFFSTLKLF